MFFYFDEKNKKKTNNSSVYIFEGYSKRGVVFNLEWDLQDTFLRIIMAIYIPIKPEKENI